MMGMSIRETGWDAGNRIEPHTTENGCECRVEMISGKL